MIRQMNGLPRTTDIWSNFRDIWKLKRRLSDNGKLLIKPTKRRMKKRDGCKQRRKDKLSSQKQSRYGRGSSHREPTVQLLFFSQSNKAPPSFVFYMRGGMLLL